MLLKAGILCAIKDAIQETANFKKLSVFRQEDFVTNPKESLKLIHQPSLFVGGTIGY